MALTSPPPPLVIGAPVTVGREWIIKAWASAATQAAGAAGLKPTFVIALSRGADALRQQISTAVSGLEVVWAYLDEPPLALEAHQWDISRYEHMAMIRNELLATVRILKPQLFWSLDTDIIAHADSLAMAEELTGQFDAVGMRCYMDPTSSDCPSYAMLDGGRLVRSECLGVVKVDVIMASKLMTPAAYAIDYTAHPCGEDVGWSIAATAANLRLGWDGRVASKHCMAPWMLDRVDPRVGF